MLIKNTQHIDEEIYKLQSRLEELVYMNNMKDLHREDILEVSKALDQLIAKNMRQRINENNGINIKNSNCLIIK